MFFSRLGGLTAFRQHHLFSQLGGFSGEMAIIFHVCAIFLTSAADGPQTNHLAIKLGAC